jgi:hypothetical protein
MKSKELSELSPTELMEKKKTLQKASAALLGVLTVFVLAIIVLFVQEQYTVALPLSSILFSLSLILFNSKKQINDIKTELETRDNNNNII